MWLLTFFGMEDIDINSLPKTSANQSTINEIIGFVFGLAGALALLFVVIGGVRLITSEGDPNKSSEARKTIINAVAGLVITISAYAIVRFVVSRV